MLDTTLLDTVDSTPLIRVERVLPQEAKGNGFRMLVKLKMQNPGSSIKDRISKAMIEYAEAKGTLKPGMIVVKCTSGKSGIGIAMTCAAKGHNYSIFMTYLLPFKERHIIHRVLGANIHLTSPTKGMTGLKTHTEDLVAKMQATDF